MTGNPHSAERPPLRYALQALALGAVLALALYLVAAPIWAFYIAPVLAGPMLVRQLRALDGSSQR